MRLAVAILRLLVALAIVAAIVGQLLTSIAFWEGNGVRDIGNAVAHFFSFFTIQSNLVGVVALVGGAALLATGRIPEPRGWATFRACATTYLVITGIVYILLLRGIELPQGATLGWSNEVLHLIAPLWMLLDWIVVGWLAVPGRVRLAWSRVVVILAYPLAWIAYTLIRGPLVPNEVAGTSYWYPYPFLNPNLSDAGYGSVALYCLGIAVAMALVGLGVIALSRLGPLRPAPPAP